MEGCKAFQVGLHAWGEDVVGGVLGGPEGVAATATGWAGENLEHGVGWWLELVGYVRVPEEAGAEEGSVVAGVVACVDDVDVFEALATGDRCGGMLWEVSIMAMFRRKLDECMRLTL